MEVRNCRSCKRLFNYLGGQQICPDCKERNEKKFLDVKEYIRDNPHAGIRDVAEANEIDIRQLQQWVREERLQFTADSDLVINCERCGKKIYTGRFCDECKAKMANGLTRAFAGEKVEEKKKRVDGNKMRFLKK